jgi:hypothetical protein
MIACDGGDGDDVPSATETPAPSPAPEASPTPAGTTVASDDGKLSLFIPDGAMPEGTDVTISVVAHDQLPVELNQLVGSGAGYRLEPDGLTFAQPATATLTMDRSELGDPEGTQSAYALVSFNETAGREVLDSETTATVGESSVTVSAEIDHFSWITETKGSMEVKLLIGPRRQVVGHTFFSEVFVKNTNRDKVLLGSVRAEWLDSGVVSWNGPDDDRVHTSDFARINDAYTISRNGSHVCSRPGLGTYSVRVFAESSLIDPVLPSTTFLLVVLEAETECVADEPLVGAPRATPTSGVAPPQEGTPTSLAPIILVTSFGGCAHTQPGVQSEDQHKIRLTNVRATGPVVGATVEGEATGPALINNTASAVTDANGEGLLIYGITGYGSYTSTIVRVTLADGTVAQFDPASVLQVTYNVGATCTPP